MEYNLRKRSQRSNSSDDEDLKHASKENEKG